MADIRVSGTTDPNNYQSYTVESNEKNTLSMTDYFRLLAAQLQNQDVTNPMSNSEMMQQMVQMGMMQAMNAMTESMEANTATTAQTYAGSLLGQEVTVMVTEEIGGVEIPTGVKYGKVEYVSFVNGVPLFKLEGDKEEYTMSYLVGVGRIPDPYEDKEDGDDSEDGSVEGPGEGDGGTEGTEGSGSADGSTEGTGGTEDVKDPADAAQETAGAQAASDGAGTGSAQTDVTESAVEGAAAAAGITA